MGMFYMIMGRVFEKVEWMWFSHVLSEGGKWGGWRRNLLLRLMFQAKEEGDG
jgi:hypothetical protein